MLMNFKRLQLQNVLNAPISSSCLNDKSICCSINAQTNGTNKQLTESYNEKEHIIICCYW